MPKNEKQKSKQTREDRIHTANRNRKRKQRHAEMQNIKQNFTALKESSVTSASDLLHKNSSFISSIYHKFSTFYKKINTLILCFADKPISLLIFIIFAFLLSTISARISGVNILRLKLTPGWQTYQFYVCDFSAGVSSRLLLGEIISLFTEKVSFTAMEYIAGISLLVSIIIQSIISAIFCRRGVKQNNLSLVFFSLILVCNPLVLTGGYQLPGTIDHFMLITFFAAFLLIKSKLKALFIPLLCVTGILFHSAFICTYFPALIALLFCEMIFEKTKTGKIFDFSGLGVSASATVGSFLYFNIVKLNHFTMTADEFYQHMASRFLIPQEKIYEIHNYYGPDYIIFREYFDMYLFGIFKGVDQSAPGDFLGRLNWVARSFTDNSAIITNAVILGSITLLYFSVIVLCFHRQKGIRKLPALPFFMVPFQYIFSLSFTTDLWRFAGATLISEIMIVLYLLTRDDTKIFDYDDTHKITKNIMSVLYLIIFIFSTVYCFDKGYM